VSALLSIIAFRPAPSTSRLMLAGASCLGSSAE
jgi:hypothetical protein